MGSFSDVITEFHHLPPLRHIPNLRLLSWQRLSVGAIGEQAMHERALDLPRGGDDGILGLDGALDGAEDVGDATLLGEGRERNRDGQEVPVVDGASALDDIRREHPILLD